MRMWRYEVSSWVTSASGNSRYEVEYAGDGIFGAIAAMLRLKKRGVGDIRLEWRPW